MIAQFVQDLVHLESGEDRLDQHRRLDGAALDAELVLGMVEDVVPEARLEMVLELRQIEVGAGAVFEELPRIVEKVEAEIEQAAGHWLAVDMDMVFGQVHAARPDHQTDRKRVGQGKGVSVGEDLGDRRVIKKK